MLPCVTLNRKHSDTEIVCGVYWADWCGEEESVIYRGLGDDPAAYLLDHGRGRLHITDDHIETTRQARDHREQVGREFLARADGGPAEVPPDLEKVIDDARLGKHHSPHYAKEMLRIALRAAAQLNPVSAAVMMFTEGFSDIHHLFRAHRLARGLAEDRDAREMLEEIEAKVEHLPHHSVQAIMEALAAHHGRSLG